MLQGTKRSVIGRTGHPVAPPHVTSQEVRPVGEHISMTVNGAHGAEVEPRLLLVHFLRDTSVSPARTSAATPASAARASFHFNGEAVKSCTSWRSRPTAAT